MGGEVAFYPLEQLLVQRGRQDTHAQEKALDTPTSLTPAKAGQPW